MGNISQPAALPAQNGCLLPHLRFSPSNGSENSTSVCESPRSSTGRCPCSCDYAADAGCTCRDLNATVSVALTKSPVAANYPLTYRQQFNYKPYEVMLRPNSGSCSAGGGGSTPTCGYWYYNNVAQPNSEGFCCSCSLADTWDATFGGMSERTCVAWIDTCGWACDWLLAAELLMNIYSAFAL